MRFKALLSLSFLFPTGAAYAETIDPEKSTNPEWSVGFSGGVAIVEGASDQTFGSLSINKDFGDSYAGVSFSYIDSGNIPGLINAIPASTTEVSISAGTSLEALNFDGYLSYGRRNFDTETLSRNGQSIAIDSGGETLGLGFSTSYDVLVSEQLFITPIVSVDYNKLDTARVAALPNGDFTAIGNKEDGVTGSLGIAVQRLFGTDDRHLISFLGNAVTTSNTTSFNPGSTQYPVLRALASRDEQGQKDSWAEIGTSLSLAVGKNLSVDLSLIRTFGFLNSDVTSVSAGLRHSF